MSLSQSDYITIITNFDTSTAEKNSSTERERKKRKVGSIGNRKTVGSIKYTYKGGFEIRFGNKVFKYNKCFY